VAAPKEIDINGHVDAKGVRYLGKATKMANGMYQCLADVDGALCVVECRIVEDDGLEAHWADIHAAKPVVPPKATPVVNVRLYADDALLLQGFLRQQQGRFRDADNEVMVDMLLRVETALSKARGQ
jgi:hypothetical protein